MDPNEIGVNTKNLLESAQDRHYWRALVNAKLIDDDCKKERKKERDDLEKMRVIWNKERRCEREGD